MNRLKDKTWLYTKYVTEQLSVDAIVNLLPCGKTTVHRYMKKYNIPTRTLSSSHAIKNSNLELIKNRDWLYEQYITLGKTPRAIQSEFGIGSTTISRYLKEYNIPTRNVSDAKLGDSLSFLKDKNWMIDQYITQKNPLGDIATELSCSTTAVIAYLNEHGIERRTWSDAAILEETKLKYKNSNLEKHGVENGAQSKAAQCKIKSTNLERYGVEHPTQSHMIDAMGLLKDREWLYNQYTISHKTAEQISDELGINDVTVGKYLRIHNIPIVPSSSISSKEYKIRDFLDTHGIIYETSNRSLIKPLELDIFIPECNIAIEVHGLYWHSEEFKDNAYHEYKRIQCNNVGIRLIQLYEDDINTKWDLLQRFLLNAIGKTNDERIFARKCYVNHNPKISDCKLLLDTYHIQGYAAQNKALTLESNGETVAVMLFKGNVLTRYATSKKVLGGFGKLLKASGLDEIITFIDLDTFSGETYFKTGFTIDKYLAPDYKYIVRGLRVHKFNFRLSKFKNDPDLIFEEGKTERELARMNKLYRIYDSGKYRLIWKKN